ncbi:MAG: hypothetical protein SFV81_27035 [Pirellulaceae bacterium]|nr:hypothetical protein [Pirellulaceae bacterium]
MLSICLRAGMAFMTVRVSFVEVIPNDQVLPPTHLGLVVVITLIYTLPLPQAREPFQASIAQLASAIFAGVLFSGFVHLMNDFSLILLVIRGIGLSVLLVLWVLSIETILSLLERGQSEIEKQTDKSSD